ncbi:hypothetical protein FB451DRAFT_1516123 [Mycena latifolia]|nr:hypothetical protein FB451DRAFT_1516123 [Mycena latifolia]
MSDTNPVKLFGLPPKAYHYAAGGCQKCIAAKAKSESEKEQLSFQCFKAPDSYLHLHILPSSPIEREDTDTPVAAYTGDEIMVLICSAQINAAKIGRQFPLGHSVMAPMREQQDTGALTLSLSQVGKYTEDNNTRKNYLYLLANSPDEQRQLTKMVEHVSGKTVHKLNTFVKITARAVAAIIETKWMLFDEDKDSDETTDMATFELKQWWAAIAGCMTSGNPAGLGGQPTPPNALARALAALTDAFVFEFNIRSKFPWAFPLISREGLEASILIMMLFTVAHTRYLDVATVAQHVGRAAHSRSGGARGRDIRAAWRGRRGEGVLASRGQRAALVVAGDVMWRCGPSSRTRDDVFAQPRTRTLERGDIMTARREARIEGRLLCPCSKSCYAAESRRCGVGACSGGVAKASIKSARCRSLARAQDKPWKREDKAGWSRRRLGHGPEHTSLVSPRCPGAKRFYPFKTFKNGNGWSLSPKREGGATRAQTNASRACAASPSSQRQWTTTPGARSRRHVAAHFIERQPAGVPGGQSTGTRRQRAAVHECYRSPLRIEAELAREQPVIEERGPGRTRELDEQRNGRGASSGRSRRKDAAGVKHTLCNVSPAEDQRRKHAAGVEHTCAVRNGVQKSRLGRGCDADGHGDSGVHDADAARCQMCTGGDAKVNGPYKRSSSESRCLEWNTLLFIEPVAADGECWWRRRRGASVRWEKQRKEEGERRRWEERRKAAPRGLIYATTRIRSPLPVNVKRGESRPGRRREPRRGSAAGLSAAAAIAGGARRRRTRRGHWARRRQSGWIGDAACIAGGTPLTRARVRGEGRRRALADGHQGGGGARHAGRAQHVMRMGRRGRWAPQMGRRRRRLCAQWRIAAAAVGRRAPCGWCAAGGGVERRGYCADGARGAEKAENGARGMENRRGGAAHADGSGERGMDRRRAHQLDGATSGARLSASVARAGGTAFWRGRGSIVTASGFACAASGASALGYDVWGRGMGGERGGAGRLHERRQEREGGRGHGLGSAEVK